MLDHYFLRPQTIDRIRNSWLGPAVEKYVTFLTEKNYAARVVFARVPIVMEFGRFAQERGATLLTEFPACRRFRRGSRAPTIAPAQSQKGVPRQNDERTAVRHEQWRGRKGWTFRSTYVSKVSRARRVRGR